MIKSKKIEQKIEDMVKYVIQGKESGMYVFEPNFSSAQCGTSIVGKQKVVMLTSNNYLGLATHPDVVDCSKKAITKYGTGTCGARLHNGTTNLHTELEEACANFFGTEAAVILSAGYLANLAAISSVADEETVIITDQFNHMSIVDGINMSNAQVRIFKHNDMNKLEYILKNNKEFKKKLIIVEGVYSMEGDIAPLEKVVELAEKYDASILVDEAHSFGFIGEKGQGVSELKGVGDRIHMRMTTFSKSLANVGGCIATDKKTALYIKHNAHQYIFNASMPPSAVAGTLQALKVMKEERWRREKLWENTLQFRRGIQKIGLNTMGSTSPVVPIYVGNDDINMKITKELLSEGVYIATAVFPSVPKNESRLRATITASLSGKEIDFALQKIEVIFRKHELIN
ncbi:pyridoxal phosphate-dependent aminotransferase family protein [Leuconostoc gelidum subsp. gasicomitatum]|nr:pyridoxal phosphate-dependent aminotransferase family protein [Leuconostoc gasicomitatum]MBZ5959116.1 pyridoxal phosphate-dependent aminotransferase family protein [Leuconostoc gasicomitatum]MBZ5965586.1 pyridoxal phosphate-dependent aminotransferase family protein [Leuconostoc gasicomitatum]MBZ5980155.1 pyridoxal phosphate-dependent aminotransferase family protein [Leuconostoc gasicomitatum]MBZ5982529.1 pyridoxal phosphate-dependent aminotransferase family protein [Leuconostoc gasicomitatum